MSKIILLEDEKEKRDTITKIFNVNFKNVNDPQLYKEEFRKIGDSTNLVLTHTGIDITSSKLVEDVYAGGYTLHIKDRTYFFDYAETLDLYILLNSLYNKDDGILNIQDLYGK